MLHVSDKPEIEYFAGRRVPKVSPQRTHAIVQLTLGAIVKRYACGRGLTGTEWRMLLSGPGEPKTSLVPDVSFYTHERLAHLTATECEEPPIAPDLAAEIRSPLDRATDVEWKMRVYLRYGAIAALDVIPGERVIRAFTTQGITLVRESETFTIASLPWLVFSVAEVFAEIA